MTWVIWIMCKATAKNDKLKSHHKNTPIFWTLLKFSTNSVCSSFKIKLFLARHAVAQHNKTHPTAFLFLSSKVPKCCFKMMQQGPIFSVQSQQSWLFNQWRANNFSATFFCGTAARMMFLFIRTPKFRDVIDQDGSQDSTVSKMTHYRLNGTGIESRWGKDFPQPSKTALGPTQPPVQWVPGLSQV